MSAIRSALPLVIGLAIGAVGAVLIVQSMPPPAGSLEERAMNLQSELTATRNRLLALEARDPRGLRKAGRTVADRARGIAEDFRDGKEVTPDDLLRAIQPAVRDLSPIFERIRTKELERAADTLAGEYARKYSLTPAQQESLRGWLHLQAEQESKRYFDFVSQDGITLQAMAEASQDIRLDKGLDAFMADQLHGDELKAFQADRLAERAGRIEQEADRRVERLNAMVELDETQRGQVFSLMARTAEDYDPSMAIEGVDPSPAQKGVSPREAVLGVLRPEQREAFEAAREKKREDARTQLGEIGLSLPEDWDEIEESGF